MNTRSFYSFATRIKFQQYFSKLILHFILQTIALVTGKESLTLTYLCRSGSLFQKGEIWGASGDYRFFQNKWKVRCWIAGCCCHDLVWGLESNILHCVLLCLAYILLVWFFSFSFNSSSSLQSHFVSVNCGVFLVVRLAHSAELRSCLRHVSSAPSVAIKRSVQKVLFSFYACLFIPFALTSCDPTLFDSLSLSLCPCAPFMYTVAVRFTVERSAPRIDSWCPHYVIGRFCAVCE